MSDIVERLRQVQGDNEDAREAANEIERLHKIAEAWRKENYYWEGRWRDTQAALSELVDAVTTEVNEKGGGGYILARLADARRALEPKP